MKDDERITVCNCDFVAGVYDIDEQLSLDVARRRQCLVKVQVSNDCQCQWNCNCQKVAQGPTQHDSFKHDLHGGHDKFKSQWPKLGVWLIVAGQFALDRSARTGNFPGR